jgi:hypothetical protein
MKKKVGRPKKKVEKEFDIKKIKRPVGRPRKLAFTSFYQENNGPDTIGPSSPNPQKLESVGPLSPGVENISIPETPAPETPAPETPAPETPAPETPAPETPAPETPAPETNESIPLNFTKEELDKLFDHDIVEDVKDLEKQDIELEKLIDSRKLSVVAFNCIAILRNKDYWNLTDKEGILAGRILDYLMVHYRDKLKPYIVAIVLGSGFLTLIASRVTRDIQEEMARKNHKKLPSAPNNPAPNNPAPTNPAPNNPAPTSQGFISQWASNPGKP